MMEEVSICRCYAWSGAHLRLASWHGLWEANTTPSRCFSRTDARPKTRGVLQLKTMSAAWDQEALAIERLGKPLSASTFRKAEPFRAFLFCVENSDPIEKSLLKLSCLCPRSLSGLKLGNMPGPARDRYDRAPRAPPDGVGDRASFRRPPRPPASSIIISGSRRQAWCQPTAVR